MKIPFLISQIRIKIAKILLKEDTKNGLDIVSVPITRNAISQKIAQKYFLCVVAIFRNESHALGEWLEFHLKSGVEHFYLYDNQSEDNYMEKLAPYIERGKVTLLQWPSNFGNGGQVLALTHAIGIFESQTTWLAHIDIDEFIFPKQNKNLKEVLKKLNEYDCVLLPWRCFGPSGQNTKEYNSVIRTFNMMANLNEASDSLKYELTRTKAIFKPDQVVTAKVHGCITSGKTVHLDGQDILLNHYITKSEEDFNLKISRAHPWSNTHVLEAWRKKRLSMFNFLKESVVSNDEIIKYIEQTEVNS